MLPTVYAKRKKTALFKISFRETKQMNLHSNNRNKTHTNYEELEKRVRFVK